MEKYISGEYEGICKIEGKRKIGVVYIENWATKSIAAKYVCYDDNCTNYECAANDGYNDSYFKLDKLINAF